MEIQSPFRVKLTCSDAEDLNFADFIFDKIAQFISEGEERPALCDPERGVQWLFSELQEATSKCRDRLCELNVRQKSRLALVTSNTARVVFVYLASAQIGCLVVSINGWASADEICQQIEAVESTHIVVENQFSTKIEDSRRKTHIKGLTHFKSIKLLGDVLGDTSRAKKDSTQFPLHNFAKRNSDAMRLGKNSLKEEEISFEEENISIATSNASNAPFSLETPLFIFFAYSGISSTPKPMVITHQTLIRNLKQISSPIFCSEFESKSIRLLLAISIHHIFGAISTFYSLINGSLLFTLSKYTPQAFFEAMLHNNISHVHCTTTMVQALALEVNRFFCPSLRSIVVGGASFDSIAAKICKAKLNIAEYRHMYITTEIGSICTFSHSKCQKVESVGVPLPGMIFKIASFENNRVSNKPHQLGHLLVSKLSPCVFNNQKATQELYTQEGFVKTGDAARYDEEGYIYIVDRLNDLIKLNDGLLCPSEVEAVLRGHPAVIDDCAVICMDQTNGLANDNDSLSPTVAVFIVRNSIASELLSSAEIKNYISAKLPALKEFNGAVFFVTEIPRTVGGRILRRRLLQLCEQKNGVSRRESSFIQVSSRSIELDSRGGSKLDSRRIDARSTRNLPATFQRSSTMVRLK